MENRKQNIQVKFYVTAEEKELMEQKMAQIRYNKFRKNKRDMVCRTLVE